MVSPTSTSRKLTEQNHHPINYIFRTVVNSTILAHALALKAKMADKTQIAICDDSGATDQTFEADFAAEVAQSGGKLIQVGCDFADAEFKPEAVIQRAINAGANSLLLDPHVDRVDKAIAVAKANKANNRKGLALFGNPSMQTEKTLLNGAVVNDMILAVPWHPVDSMNEEFKQNVWVRAFICT